MNKKGFSLVELIFANVILACFIFAVSQFYKTFTQTLSQADRHADMVVQTILAVRLVEQVGRLAQLCQKTSLGGGALALDCVLDPSRPPSGTLQWVRFRTTDQGFEYQLDRNNDGTFGAVSTRSLFPGVVGFTLCDGADMDLNNATTPGTCPLQPTALSTLHAQDMRFFRFELLAQTPVGNLPSWGAHQRRYQGSFYRRNPPPASLAGVSYSW